MRHANKRSKNILPIFSRVMSLRNFPPIWYVHLLKHSQLCSIRAPNHDRYLEIPYNAFLPAFCTCLKLQEGFYEEEKMEKIRNGELPPEVKEDGDGYVFVQMH